MGVQLAKKNDFKIKVENIVASLTLNVKVPLNKIVSKNDSMEYEPEQFPGVIYRMTDPKAAALIFGSGKIVCTGAKSIDDVYEVIKKVLTIIRSTGTKVPRDYKVDVENIVASAKLDGRLNLDKIAFNLENSEYEPEQFPGLVYRMLESKVAFLLFSSGKIICTGARHVKVIRESVEKVNIKLKKLKAIVPEKPK